MTISQYALCAATAFAALSSSVFSSAARADEADPADTILVTGLRAETSLDTKSSGSRLGLTVFETPASIEVLDGDAIRARGDLSIQEAVSRATGLTFQGSPGNGNTAMAARGFSGQGSVQLLVDGTRLFVASGTLTFPVDPWTVERIDVLRGPSSVISGEGAIGGAVNVIMKKPSTDRSIMQARVAYGSDNAMQIAGDAGGPVGGGLSYRVAASFTRSDGWPDRNSDNRNLAISGALRWDASPTLSFTLASDYGDVEMLPYFGSPLNNGKFDRRFRFINFNITGSEDHFRDNWTRLTTEWQASDAISLRNVAYYLSSDRDWLNAESYRYSATTGLVTRSDYLNIVHRQDQIGDRGDLTLRTPLGGGVENSLLVGFDVNRVKFRHINNSPYGGSSVVDPFDFEPGGFITPVPTTLGFRTLTTQYSVFMEDQLQLRDWASLVGGFRQDWYDLERIDARTPANGFKRKYHSTSGRFGLVLNPAVDTALYGSFTVGTDPISALITTSNAQKDFGLSPARQFEVGVKQRFLEGRGSASIALFDIEKRRLLTPDPENRLITQQVGKRTSRGVEATLAVQLTDAFGIEANGTILKARFKEFGEVVNGVVIDRAGNTPPGIPTKTANISANWRFLEPLQARVSARFVAPRWTDNANTLRVPGYEVVDLGLRWTISEKLAIDGRISNVFDKIYPIGSNSSQWLLGAPRRFDVRLDMSL
ncbi:MULTISPECIES: TonB-dependent receptor [Novosphingobium]|jgi:iron complex outermembrane receptor protein|uniref:TonB-dependent receptor n=1 Tax=Novosphingobium TaxID=165696 RepID=UPI0022F28C9C|nr:TonB-dependent receptor [Novosphingobium resinovorum]GLK43816.1 TonB-dependent receptor [Novosphingobium resinovorum]